MIVYKLHWHYLIVETKVTLGSNLRISKSKTHALASKQYSVIIYISSETFTSTKYLSLMVRWIYLIRFDISLSKMTDNHCEIDIMQW